MEKKNRNASCNQWDDDDDDDPVDFAFSTFVKRKFGSSE